MSTTWVVVADEAIARILQRSARHHPLTSVEELTDPDAHARGRDLRRDAEGRRAAGATAGSRQNTPHRLMPTANVTASAGEDEQHLEAEGFARQVAEHLQQALQQKYFDELRIVAAPRFLGLLRKALSPEVERTVVEEVNKDLVHMGNDEITRRLFPDEAGVQPATS